MTRAACEPIDLDDYAFELPDACIAQHPLPERDAARLMRLDRRTGERIEPGRDTRVRDLPVLLRPGDLLVVNTTRVLAARLRGRKETGGRAEALLLGPVDATDPSLQRALVRSSGRLHAGMRFRFGPEARAVEAEIVALGAGEGPERGLVELRFAPGASPYDLGEAPLPPYIRRLAEASGPRGASQAAADRERYQTVFAEQPGAVAAPTAGLHFTDALFAALAAAGVQRAEVVLHVGLGTFRPLSREDLARRRLHPERYVLPEATAEAVARTRDRGGRVIAVGTTTTRVLETCATPAGDVRPGAGETELFIAPGDRFRVVDGLITNFHLPRSSLLLLVAAMVGREPLLRAYASAIEEGYRFYSYGDAMLIV